ncbi:MAG: alkaline phosphatase family protein [Candidatus Micrarchaeaceae archaeon]
MEGEGVFTVDFENYDTIIETYVDKEHPDFIKPAFGKGCIADIPGLAESKLLGGKNSDLPSKFGIGNEESDHVIILLLDGFGHDLLRYAVKNHEMKHLRSVIERSLYTPITSVFPSTTVTSLFTLYMDMQPIEHEIIGYTQYIRELGSVCNMLSMTPISNIRNDLLGAGWIPRTLKDRESFSKRMSNEGVNSYIYLPNTIRNNGMSRIIAAGTNLEPYYSTSHMFASIVRNVKASRKKSMHIGYISSIDSLSHKIGPRTRESVAELESIFYSVDVLREELKSTKTAILISADHGHVNVGSSNLFDISKDKELYNLFRTPVVGDARAAVLRILCDHIDEAENYLLEKYGASYEIFRSSQMIEKGYFGNRNTNKNENDRFGDLIIVPKSNTGIIDSNLTFLDKEMSYENMVGMHGGLLAEEMIVPLILLFS